MKVSEITCDVVKRWGRIEIDDDNDDIESVIIPSAKARLSSYTGLSKTELDEHDELAVACLALCVFLYDNREMNIVNDKENAVISSFLDAYRVNLL